MFSHEVESGRVTSMLTLLTRTLVRFFRRRGGLPNYLGLSRRATPSRRGILKTDLGQYFAAGDIKRYLAKLIKVSDDFV